MWRKKETQIQILTLSILAALLISLTKFYSIGYLVLIILAVLYLPTLNITKSYLQRFVLFLLTFLATIPLVGLVCWLAGIENYAILNSIGFIILSSILYVGKDSGNRVKLPIIEKVDIVGIILAILPILVISVSYLPGNDKSAALFQLASEGWDNGSHILMMEDNSTHNGYMYGPWSTLKNEMVQQFNAYPQAWHLTSANFTNGFGGNRFIPSMPIETIFFYMLVCFAWMVATIYLFVLTAWRLYEYITKESLTKFSRYGTIVALTLMIEMVVIVSSFMHGFMNYIGVMSYILVMALSIIEMQLSSKNYVYTIAILSGTMTVLTWFLTLPAVGLAILALLITRYNSWSSGLISTLKDHKALIITVVCILAMLLQVLIFQKYSPFGGGQNQLNTGSRVIPFVEKYGQIAISEIFFGVIALSAIIYMLKDKLSQPQRRSLLTILVPWTVLALIVFLYQNITVGFNSYYLPKVLALSILVSTLVLAVPLNRYLSSLSRDKLLAPIALPSMAVVILITVVIGTGQSTFGLNKLFQRNARTGYEVAKEVVSNLPRTINGKESIVVFTNRHNYEGVDEGRHGKLEQRVIHQPLNCSYFVVASNATMKYKYNSLATCADTLAKEGKKVIVITSDKTYEPIKSLHKSNIVIKNT